jgi:glyoxylase-like metal-dependent hydrolase (beta-lactamase superfamily II)/8-oxo-dGTP pyrophosphatase MutT (NUDIX family)
MASPRSAAALILVRENPDLEVFWMRRAPHMAFQGGFYAFPGGKLEPGEEPSACAAREVLEETGARVDPASFIDVGRWVTPLFAPIRFDTYFFLAACPPDQTPHVASKEHDAGEWIRPADGLREWMEGRILLAPPVLHALRCLSEGLKDIQARMKASPWSAGDPAHEAEMKPGIRLVPLRTPTLPPATHTNCYVIGEDDVIVIDPASPYEEEQAILDRVLAQKRVREIWLTHLHRDHVGGANHLREKSGAAVAAHPITARDLEGLVHVDRTFADNERLELQGSPGWSLQVLHTPGHARGHVCIFESRTGSLIMGDLMAGVGTIVIDPPEGHMATYLDSLRRMQALPVTALFPAHGPSMANAKARIQEYLDHRLARERMILEAWKAGTREPAEIVKAVYTDVPEAMHALAERSVIAHLDKLREEGRFLL